ncbi:hypothetical protein [Novosphingobium sp. BL-52-GroH]|uniref:hypothetical protein n=1 Tax=Novosphingobium sp. BL-52-GroH TaxID=3349877 RepID=UPI00384FE1DA
MEVDPIRVNEPTDNVAIRNGLIKALEGSQRIVPHPSQDQWTGFFKPFHDAAGVRSFKAFMKNARCIYIDAADDHIRLTPLRNLGARGGFEEMADAAISMSPGDMDGAAFAIQKLLTENCS